MLWKCHEVYDKIKLCKSFYEKLRKIDFYVGISIKIVEKQVLLKKYMTEETMLMTENLQKWRQNHGRLQNKGAGTGKKAE